MRYVFAFLLASPFLFADLPSGRAEAQAQAGWEKSLSTRSLTWEPNRGQGAPSAQFLARAANYVARAGDRELLLLGAEGVVSPMRLAGQGPSQWAAEERRSGVTNYFYGKDASRWVSGVPQFAQVRLSEAYPGIDWVLAQEGRAVAYRFEVAAKADPALIRLTFPGLTPTLDAAGNLRLSGQWGYWEHRAPRAFQVHGDGQRHEIAVSFVVPADGPVMFRLGEYDSRLPLVIDPVISFHLYQGGSGRESAVAVAVSPQGFIHYAGWTDSQNLFLAGSPFQDINIGRLDLFVTKLYPDGQFFFATYVGGSRDDVPAGMGVDAFGNVLIAGTTDSPNFPISSNGFQPAYGGGSNDAFLVKMTAQGTSLLHSTYIGGSNYDICRGIAVDSSSNVTLVGYTASTDFPQRNPWQPSFGGFEDIFVFKLLANGTDVAFSTIFGADQPDQAHAVAVDRDGNAIIAGHSTCNSLNPGSKLGPGGNVDVLVLKWRAQGNGAEYITCIGGAGIDSAGAVALDASGNIYVGGATASLNFPTAQPLQPSYAGAVNGSVGDAFLLKLPPTGNSLLYSTYFGGNRDDSISSLTIDAAGAIWATGLTFSANFPGSGGQGPAEGARTAFVTRIHPQGAPVLNSYFFGPLPLEVQFGVTIDANLVPYIVGGLPANAVLPSAPAPLRPFVSGLTEAWIAKLAIARLQLVQETYPAVVSPVTEFTFIQRVSNRGPEDAERVIVQGTLPLGLALVGCTVANGGTCGSGPAGFRAEIATLGVGRVGEVRVTVRVGLVPDGTALPVDATATAENPDDNLADNTIRTTLFTAPPGTFCNYSSSPLTTNLPASGGATTFLVNAPFFCPWTISTPNQWITLGSSATATGNGSATFLLSAWSGNTPRTGSVTVAGQRYVLIQRAATDQPFFTDVPSTHPFFDTVQLVRSTAITTGCDATRYCPDDVTSRGQMAVFIVRSLLGTGNFSFSNSPYFTDVPATHPQFRFIQKLRELGVTNGCTATTYCPEDPVNRGQMAAFLIRARLGISAGQNFPFNDTSGFQDVPPSHPFYAAIQKMRELGITSGCTATNYCPDQTTTRGQMSAFLSRAFLAP